MHHGVSWGDLGCPGAFWGYPGVIRPTHSGYSFHKNLLYFLSNHYLQSSRPYKQIPALYLFLIIRCVSVSTRTETLKFNI